MKARIPIFCVLFLLPLCETHSQEVHQCETFTLSTSLSSNKSYEYTASDYIELSPGFSSQPSGNHNTTLQLDPYGIFPPETGISGGVNVLDDGVVGAIGGTVDVGATGGAVYSIPIRLPEGINGMQPNLAVTYNSQSGNGLLGWGWDLAGLSAITRAGTTLYHDGYMSGVDFVEDRFYLDGQRLMVVNGNYGANGAEYKTETDGMSKIVSYTCDSTTGPAWFKVWTAGGLVMEYGSTGESRIGLRQRNDVCLWLLSRVTDSDGNYMSYHYFSNEVGYRLTGIEYTCNGTLVTDPAYKVQLVYRDRPEREMAFVGDNCLQQSKLLKEIDIVYDNDSVLWRYNFNYDEATGLGTRDMYPRLTSVGFSCGGQSYNPTVISWSQQSSDYGHLLLKVDDNYVNHDYQPHQYDDLCLIKFTGDFNGDGYTDLVSTWSRSGQKWAYIYLNETGRDGSYWDLTKADSLMVNDSVDWIYPGDFNGDGLSDLLFVNRGHLTMLGYYDRVTLEFYLSRKNADGSFSFNHCDAPQSLPYLIWHSKGLSLAMGDFSGNRRDSFVFQTTETDKNTRKHYHIYYDDATGKMRQSDIGGVDVNAERVQAADFDGDGITELWYCETDSDVTAGKLVKLDQNGNFVTVSSNILTRYHKVFPGDFNGDGKADFLSFATDGNGGGTWQINLTKGSGLFWPEYGITGQMGIGDPGDHGFSMRGRTDQAQLYKMVGLADFNGDGKTDIATVKCDALPFDSLVILYAPFSTQGCSYRKAVPLYKTGIEVSQEYRSVIGNFLGRENAAVFSDDKVFSVTPLSDRYTVSCVSDGMGNSTCFEYDYLMPNLNNPGTSDFYVMNGLLEDHSDGLFAISLPIKGVKKIREYNAGGIVSSSSFQYEGAMTHIYGKGFLGFTRKAVTVKTDSEVQSKTVSWGDLTMMQPFPAIVPLCDSVFTGNGHLIACTQYSFLPCVNNMDTSGKTFMPLMAGQVSRTYDPDSHDFLKKTRAMNQFQSDTPSSPGYYANTVKTVSSWTGTTGDDTVTECADYDFQNVETTQFENDIVSSWILNRPKTSTTISFFADGLDTISHCLAYTYYTDKPYRVSYVLDLPNDGSDTSDSLAVRTAYVYDGFGRVVSETVKAPNVGNLPDRTTTREYGSAYSYRFMTRETSTMGYSSSYAYDTYYGHLVSETDCNGRTTRYDQDPLGITVWTHYPDSTRSCSAMRWKGRTGYLVWTKSSGNPSTTTYYDFRDNKKRVSVQGIKGVSILTDTEYDQHGRIYRESLPYYEGDTVLWTTFSYDSYNRIVNKTYPDQTREYFLYDGMTVEHVVRPFDGITRETATHTNAAGWTVWTSEKLDGGGENTVTYGYYPDGSLAWTEVNGQQGTRDTLGYDRRGNRVFLKDPDYGVTRSTYNAFGQLVRETSPRGYATQYAYDSIGRTVSRVLIDGNNAVVETTEWVYDETAGHKGLLLSVIHDNETETFTYDSQLRLTNTANTAGGVTLNTSYTYDSLSRPLTVTYPSGVSIRHSYRTNGYPLGDQDQTTGVFLWRLEDKSAAGSPTSLRYGNNLAETLDYDNRTGRLEGIKACSGNQTIVNLAYVHDGLGDLTSRTDHRLSNGAGVTESFTYDRLDRLATISLDRVQMGQMQYDAFGRILSKKADGSVVFSTTAQSYDMGDRPHALRSAIVSSGVFPSTPQTVSYTGFDKVGKVKMGNDSLVYTYGYGHQRIAMEEHVGNTVRTKRYVGACERVTETMGSLTIDRWLTYLSGPTGVYAVVVTMNGTNTLHYILKDNLGSWTTITDSDGVVEQRLSYDAWGNLRNPETWSGSFTGTPMFDRGFTGHEHLYNFGLVNMNGRMYDPMMSSFLSVDQYVQSPDNSQNFNRYAYCLNNPLRYVDPDGELWWEAAIVGAIIGSFANATAQVMSGNVNNSSQFWMAAGIGALSGALGGVAGYGVGYGMTALLHGAEGFWLGSVVGSSSGFVGGFVGTSTAAWMQGASFSQGFWAGLKSAGWGAFLGGVLGGLEAGYYAKQCKGNFWTGDDIVVAEHHTGNQYHGSKTRASINAKRYNNSSAFIDDVKTIKSRMNNIYDNWESLVSGEIETRSGNYGMTDDLKSYVNIDKENGKGYSLVDGFVSKRRTGLFNNVVKYDVHIAPGVTAYDVVSFKAVVGHELIHSFHYNLFGFNFDSAQSERVAYQYTIETYENAGYYLNAHQNRIVASQYGYSNIRPNHFYITPF